MRSLGRFTVTIVLLLAPLAGCDGRGGSSGLDITSENAAISQALETKQCLDFQALRICPAAEPVAATPTPGGAPSVETSLGNATSIDCFQSIPGGPCTFTLRFVPRAFPSNTTFEALARPDASSNPWVLGPDPVVDSSTGEVSYDATLVLTSVQGGPPNQVQLAVLAFAGPSSSSPTEVQDLHQTAATFAFVTQVLAVNVVTPTMTPTPTGRPTKTPTPTGTPGASDCCQCPSSCAVPVDGSCGSCTVVFGATCYGEMLCTLRTPTPTLTPSLTPTPCLTDNGDGTITDGCTGLMWEKKDQAGGLHDYSTSYPWAGQCDDGTLCQPDAGAAAACAEAKNGAVGCSQCSAGSCTFSQVPGPNFTMITPTSTIWGWLAQLNQGEGFAGHTDWRIPSVGKEGDTAELETILLSTCTVGGPCVSPVFNTNCDPGENCGPGGACGTGQTCLRNLTCQATPGCTVTSCSCSWDGYSWSVTSDVSTYAGTDAGVFASTNAGSSWSAVNTNLTTLSVSALAINPATPTTLYAGTSGGGVFESTDGGGSWSAVNTGLTTLTVSALAINPRTPTTLYAGTSGGGVFESTNGGGSWSAVNAGLTTLTVSALAISPTTPTTPTMLYAGTSGGGVFESTSGGSSWSAVNTGLTSLTVSALAINPTPPRFAWFVDFSSGSVISGGKTASESVRAVRGRKTVGANDCCQCPSSCAAPVDGTCGSCTVVFGAACEGEQLCALHTPTPTPSPSSTPTPCLKDNGDGTVTDGCRELMWEKKDHAGGLNDSSTVYSWAGACTGNGSLCQPNAAAAGACAEQTGGALGCGQCASGTCMVGPNNNGAATTIWDWLYQLNSSGFAGYNDWRIPALGADGLTPELAEILAAPWPCSGLSHPCVSAAFNTACTSGCDVTNCSCTQSAPYWSAPSFPVAPGGALEVDFTDGGGGQNAPKTNAFSVRAVRSGP